LAELHIHYRSLLTRVYNHVGCELPLSRVDFGSKFLSEIYTFLSKSENREADEHGRRKGEAGGDLALPLDFEIFSKKGCFLSFEWEKSNFTTFGPALKNLGKIP